MHYGKFSPVIRQKIPDWKSDDIRWDDWLDEQEHYILNGYQVGGERISGRYYFHLNFGKLKLLNSENYEVLGSPYHVDVYNDLFNLIDDVEKTGRDIFVWKARDKGYSYCMSSLCNKEVQFHSQNTIVTLFPKGEEVKHKQNFLEKYMTTWNSMPDVLKNHPGIKDSEDFKHYGWWETDEETNQKKIYGLDSKIAFMQVVNKDVAKSFRAKFIIVDEAGEIDCLIPLIMANRANMRKGAVKFGTTIIGGTSNSAHKGYKDVCELWHNASSYGFEKFMIPAQKALFGYVKNGNNEQETFIDLQTGKSLEDKALAFLEKELDTIKKTKNTKAIIEHKQNYPTCEADMFLKSNVSPFSQEKIAEQKNELLTNKNITNYINVGDLYMVFENGKNVVKFRENPNGLWKIFQKPSDSLLRPDVGAVDGYKFDQAEYSDSKGAILIYRDFQGINKLGNVPICIYHNRPEKKETFNYHALLTAMYYNCKMLYESIDEDMINYFIMNAAEHHLALRPNLLSVIGTSNAKNKYGVYPSDHNIAISLELAIEEFDEHYQNIPFVELLDELGDYGIKNTDLGVTYRWAVLHAKNNATYYKRKEDSKDKKRRRGFSPYMIMVGNSPVWVTSQIQEQKLISNSYGIHR